MSRLSFADLPKACTTQWLESGGVPIALSVWHSHPQAVTMLFYPGTMASPALYPVLLNALWRLGCNVVGLHPLSHGASPRINKNFVFADLLRNGLDAAHWARQHFNGPLVVTGHSQGGILALAHAIHDERIAATFPLCTLLPHHAEAGSVSRFHKYLRHKETILHILNRVATFLPRLPFPFFAYLELWRITHGARRLVLPRVGTRFTYPLRFLHSLFAADLRKACEAGHIKVPVCLFSARDDALFPLALMRTMLDAIEAPHKQLIVITGGGHMMPMSALYAPEIAARMAGQCAALGLPLYPRAQDV